jgi:hypothetical protein
MAKKKSSIPKFMKYSGSIEGPADLSSRRGFSRVPVEEIVEKKVVEGKAEVKPSKKSFRGETRRTASLR